MTVTAVNRGVTGRAVLVPRISKIVDRGSLDMTGDAQLTRPVRLQHETVGRTMRGVAGYAALHRTGLMLEDEWSPLVDVAGGAQLTIDHRPVEHSPFRRTVRVVAILATDDPVVQPVSVGGREFGLLVRVTGEAESRSRRNLELFFHFRCMDGMAIGA